MNFRSSGNESVTSFNGPTHGFTSRHEPAAGVCDPHIDREDSSAKTRDQIFPQPTIETLASLSDGKSVDSIAQFRNCDDADKNLILIHFREPRE
jgi:hypothetical protein